MKKMFLLNNVILWYLRDPKLKLIKTLYCASLLRMIFAPLARAHERLHVHNIADLLEDPRKRRLSQAPKHDTNVSSTLHLVLFSL